MADYEDGIFSNLPRPRRRGERDDDDRRLSPRRLLAMNFVPEGPLPQRPRPSGKGGPSVNQGTGPVVTSVWSAADAAANGMTLSNGGLTVTPSGVTSWLSIRSSIGKTAGKLYVEFKTSVAESVDLVFGVASSGFNPVDYLGNNIYSAGMDLQTATHASAGFVANYTSSLGYAFVVNDVLALAVDFTAGSIWIAKNNVWSNSSNPVTATLPVVSFTPATVGALFPALSFFGLNSGVWTLQPTAASQTYTPPAGFTPWG